MTSPRASCNKARREIVARKATSRSRSCCLRLQALPDLSGNSCCGSCQNAATAYACCCGGHHQFRCHSQVEPGRRLPPSARLLIGAYSRLREQHANNRADDQKDIIISVPFPESRYVNKTTTFDPRPFRRLFSRGSLVILTETRRAVPKHRFARRQSGIVPAISRASLGSNKPQY